MKPNIVVFDIETKKTFDDVGGYSNTALLGISLIGAYRYKTDEYLAFEEHQIADFEAILSEKPTLVGFNSKKFDLTVLKPYLKFDPSALPHVDLMEEMANTLGHRVSLDSVAGATLGTKKSGHGLDAIRYYQNGEIDKLKKYCLDDVKITRMLFEYGAEHGELFFTSKFGKGKSRCPVSWKFEDKSDNKDQMALF